MFTGIISDVADIKRVEPIASGLRLAINSPFNDLVSGESVSVDGACLTVTDQKHGCFWVELSLETLQKTIASKYQSGQTVNLERALKMGDRLGGHFVSGHIDQVAVLKKISRHNDFFCYTFGDLPDSVQGFLINKGSITINGVSLTLNVVQPGSIELMLIPHTLKNTNLSELTVNDIVNIEFDLLAKMVKKQMQGVYDVTSV